MKVGVVSDTHGFFDPALKEHLNGVDCIVHAGDVDSQEVLDELAEIAPVHAVCGNVDPLTLDLPLSRKLRFEGAQIELQHILPVPLSKLESATPAIPAPLSYARKRESSPSAQRDSILKNFDSATRVVIFGHSHEPCLVALESVLFFNPGSAGKKRFSLPRCCGVLEISPPGIRGAILSLDGEQTSLPAEIWLPAMR